MIRLNPNPEIQASRITERETCVVIDDFLLNPEEAVAWVCEHRARFEMPERAYPGLILPVEESHVLELQRFIQKRMSRLFPFCRGGLQFHSQYSLATLQPEEFSWIQRLCHTDPRLDPARVNYAALIYLFNDPEMGGTGFYRWKDPEFLAEMSALQRDDPDAGLDILRDRYAMFREPPSYMTKSNDLAELLDVVPAKFNRLVFYSGELPHNAHITRPELLSADPADGRLTLNCFISAIPG
jgi:hypothetical protein